MGKPLSIAYFFLVYTKPKRKRCSSEEMVLEQHFQQKFYQSIFTQQHGGKDWMFFSCTVSWIIFTVFAQVQCVLACVRGICRAAWHSHIESDDHPQVCDHVNKREDNSKQENGGRHLDKLAQGEGCISQFFLTFHDFVEQI